MTPYETTKIRSFTRSKRLTIFIAAMQFVIVLSISHAVSPNSCSSSNTSCPENHFCNFNLTDINDPSIDQKGFCQTCLDHPMACTYPEYTNVLGQTDCIEKCTEAKVCSESDPCTEDGNFFCNFFTEETGNESGTCETCGQLRLNSTEDCFDPYLVGLTDLGGESCHSQCNIDQRTCDINSRCPFGMFCDYSSGVEVGEDKNYTSGNKPSGTCQDCKWHLEYCQHMDLSPDGLADCVERCNNFGCTEVGKAELFIDGVEYESFHIAGTPFATNIRGPVVDFGLGIGKNVSSVNLNGLENPVCLIRRGGTFFYRKIIGCQSRGGVAAIIYNFHLDEDLNYATLFSDEQMSVHIPAITLRGDDGLKLLNDNLGGIATVNTKSVGRSCVPDCTDLTSCPEKQFCDYDVYYYYANTHGKVYGDSFGSCRECPQEDDDDCYFGTQNLLSAASCAHVCGSTLKFPECKLCGRDVALDIALDSSTTNSNSSLDICNFCPSGMDEEHYESNFPIFGVETSCLDVQLYFDRYKIPSSNRNCELATMYNFVCGCAGPGYMKADSNLKRNALVWLPRCTAITSVIGSAIIIYEVMTNEMKRKKMNNQMLAVLSTFDLFGSIAYALTSLPIPKDQHIQGAKGNNATCTAQGFFIQLNSTAGYINLSLAVYYLMVIKFGWSQDRLKKYMVWFYLCPIATGLAFAFAGISSYTNVILWCSNGAKWWPEIPVIFAIVSATVIMTSVCIHVYKQERASMRWRYAGTRTTRESVSNSVFWQSIYYLLSFYMTW
mmetsp:Transcript_6044/g.12743  ORF Transcript_6044/g.12743 Transcript_6044/m.12743 type:complete len:776 (-) Transcript_6044:118-2445(-)